ncbi:MAG: hypothetical protein ACM3SV_06010 [Betaproteobacteria bacterium]
MANALSEHRREDVWEALSDVFVDNEIDYSYIAAQVADVDVRQLEEIFFNEVAPHCGPNLMSTIPPVWSGFDRRELANGIRAMQARNRDSLIARLRHKGFVVYCRRQFSGEWKTLIAALSSYHESAQKS